VRKCKRRGKKISNREHFYFESPTKQHHSYYAADKTAIKDDIAEHKTEKCFDGNMPVIIPAHNDFRDSRDRTQQK
jgi:hypothetical protein